MRDTLPLIETLRRQVASLLLYRAALQTEIGQAFLNLLDQLQRQMEQDGHELQCLEAYGRWFYALAEAQQSWQTYLLTQVLWADNPFTRRAQWMAETGMNPDLTAAAVHDLNILQSLYHCSSQQVSQWVQELAILPIPPVALTHQRSPNHPHSAAELRLHSHPIWTTLTQAESWGKVVDQIALYHQENGMGDFAIYHAFRWQQGQLRGIPHPDAVQLRQLTGYPDQQEQLLRNTEALLMGNPALHVLLYGSRGTGKSSLVKSLIHQYGDRGLRLVEVDKVALAHLPDIVEPLRLVPQKFIIFVDDLSFEEDDDAFKALKVVLEGGVTARPQNVVVYATSNRKHLIREFHGDRPRPSDADEIHAWDTVQEKLSFSDRFGLTLTFEPTDQPKYLDIVHHLAAQAHLDLPLAELDRQALRWATRHNGRSGRTARQFIDSLIAQL
ncbi:MAG: ATP-binding protein [Leptolyngbyaceae bacterium]|nr:ATP-binding protein [Leptolyngbyaceae bacterium]